MQPEMAFRMRLSRHANISLAMFASTNLVLISSIFISNPVSPNPFSRTGSSNANANQLFVSGVNYVKYAPEGFITFENLQAE